MTLEQFEKEALSITSVYKADVFDILRKVFDMTQVDIIINRKKELDDRAESILERLKNGEPSAYIIGVVEFNETIIKVTPDVLIPRMETEELVINLCESINFSNEKILDLCCGSGCIGLSIAKRYPTSKVVLSDISVKALEVAKLNRKINKIENASFIKSDFLDGIDGKFDYIISNPPYIPLSKKTQALYEPELALYSGEDGLDSYRRILDRLSEVLKKEGQAFFELEEDSRDGIESILKEKKIYDFEFKKDLAGKTRFLYLSLKKD